MSVAEETLQAAVKRGPGRPPKVRGEAANTAAPTFTPNLEASPVSPQPANTLAEENEHLRRQVEELREKLLSQQVVAAVAAPADTRPKKRYKVHLPGAVVRVVDAEGRILTADTMEVEAASPAEAFEEYRRYNGILSTNQTPRIEEVP